MFPQNIIFSGDRPVFLSEHDDPNFKIKVVGKFRALKFGNQGITYKRGILLPSLGIFPHLLKYYPDVIFTAAFSIWTLIALLLKPLTRWKVIIIYDGSSPEIDVVDSKFRIFVRRLMTRFTDAFITNTNQGKTYITEILKADSENVFARPYQVADKGYLTNTKNELSESATDLKHPVFLFIGQLIKRKGIDFLLNACSELKRKGYHEFTLLVVGDGEDRGELEELTRGLHIEEHVKWIGWVDYENLGLYLDISDIFVFPTIEDIWGIVVTEAMNFGKPVLCSSLAGANELVVEGENGYVFDPLCDHPEVLAEIMSRFIKDPMLASNMGKKSEQLISSHSPEAIAAHLGNVIEYVYSQGEKNTKEFRKYSKN